MAKLIKANGSEQEVHQANGKTFTAEELQGYVGGYIELVKIGTKDMYMDENGKFKQAMNINRRATDLAIMAGITDGDFVVGDVVLCDPGETD